MSVFDRTCDVCKAEGRALRADGNFGWICPACCSEVDAMRAEHKQANPDNAHRWRYQELPDLEKRLAARKKRLANQARRFAYRRRHPVMTKTEARRILRKEIGKGGIVRRLAGVGKFTAHEWRRIPEAIRLMDDVARDIKNDTRTIYAEANPEAVYERIRDAILRLYDPADTSRIRAS